jgi:hypothetical protein
MKLAMDMETVTPLVNVIVITDIMEHRVILVQVIGTATQEMRVKENIHMQLG